LGIFAEQHRISIALDTWYAAYSKFCACKKSPKLSVRHSALLEIIYLVAKIWVSTTLERNECAFDKQNERFAAIVARALEVRAECENAPVNLFQPKFSFDMGFLPLLYFVVLKCRILHLRLSALECMQALSVEQEGLWKASVMACTGQRNIEIEHGIDFGVSGTWIDSVPIETQRLRECMLDLESIAHFGSAAPVKMTFVMWRPPDELYTRTEWVDISSSRPVPGGLLGALGDARSSALHF
jgi:hypothetical protein